MKRIKEAGLALLFLLGACAVECGGQEMTVHLEPRRPAPPPPSGSYLVGVMAPSAGMALDAEWTDDVNQNERAYCAVRYSLTVFRFKNDTLNVVAVDSVVPAPYQRGATPVGMVDARCGPNVPRIHTHPPSRCINIGGEVSPRWACVREDRWKTHCFPSPTDIASLNRQTWKRPFDIVMCGRGTFTFYTPTDTT
jgi:hypothetical protein